MDPTLQSRYLALLYHYDSGSEGVVARVKGILIGRLPDLLRPDAALCLLTLYDQMIIRAYRGTIFCTATDIVTTAAERELYINEIEERLGRSADDKKEATKLAVETAKMFLTIGVAVLVATGTLLQFARSNGVSWSSPTIWAFGLTVLFLFISMRSGFGAISSAYKRADGRTNPTDVA